MMILNATMDLVDAIANRELEPLWTEGSVGCIIAKGSSLEGLPKVACCVQHFPRDGSYKVWWPDHPWTEGEQEYVDTLFDSSGEAE